MVNRARTSIAGLTESESFLQRRGRRRDLVLRLAFPAGPDDGLLAGLLSDSHFVSFGEIGFKPLPAFLCLLMEFAEHGFL